MRFNASKVKTHVDRDLVMRTTRPQDECTVENYSESEVVELIKIENGAAGGPDTTDPLGMRFKTEMERFELTGYGCTQDELLKFSERVWSFDNLKDWEGFRESLPASWRP